MNDGWMHNPQHGYDFGLTRAPGFVRMALEWRVPLEFSAALLAQPKRRWRPFEHAVGARAWLYRDPARCGPF